MKDNLIKYLKTAEETFTESSLEHMQISNGSHTLFIPDEGEGNTYRLHIGDFAVGDEKSHLLVEKLLQATADKYLEIRVSSSGGSIDEGIRLIGIIKDVFKDRITVYVERRAMSMGAITYISFDKRVSYPRTVVMFHNYSSMFYGKGGEITDGKEHVDKTVDSMLNEDIIKPGFLTIEEVEKLKLGKDYFFDTYEQCVRGITTHVLIEGNEIPAKLFVKYTNQELSHSEMVSEFMNEREV